MAIAKKELKLGLRFKINFFSSVVLNPLLYSLWFALIYAGFFSFGTSNVAGVTPSTLIPFLILGGLANIIYRTGYYAFDTKFMAEKYWHTIEGTLIAPINRISILLGIGLIEILRISIFLLAGIGIAFFMYSPSLIRLFIVIFTMILLCLMTLGMGLVKAGFILANENMLAIFQYLNYDFMFLSCFYYPIEALPSWIHPFVMINPVYHAVILIRDAWFGLPISLLSLGIVSFITLLSLLLGTMLFSLTWRKLGITG